MIHFFQLRLSRLALNRKAREYFTKKCQREHKASALARAPSGLAGLLLEALGNLIFRARPEERPAPRMSKRELWCCSQRPELGWH